MTTDFLTMFADPSTHKATAEEGGYPVVPHLQVNHSEDDDKAGLFMPQRAVDLAKFEPDNNWKPFSVKFTGQKEATTGYLCQTACMSILRATPFTMFELVERGGKTTEKLVGRYEQDYYYENKQAVKLKTRYMLLLRKGDGSLLCPTPFIMTLHGTFGAAFGSELRAFRTAVEEQYGATNMDGFFHSCFKFRFLMGPVVKGQGVASKTITGIIKVALPPDGWYEAFKKQIKENKDYNDPLIIPSSEMAFAKDIYGKSEGFAWDCIDPINYPLKKETNPLDLALSDSFSDIPF
jgi:hypothetical protein